MAKQKGIIKLQGQIDGLSFYPSVFGLIVRRPNGLTKEKIYKSPIYERTRQNMYEFRNVLKCNKYIMNAIVRYLPSRDIYNRNRLTSILTNVLKKDKLSRRGERNIARALQTVEGRDILRGFEFNKFATVLQVLRTDFELNMEDGSLSFREFLPDKDLFYPAGATHAEIKSIVSRIDFMGGNFETAVSENLPFSLEEQKMRMCIKPEKMPVGDGNIFFFIHISFYKKQNGILYPLENRQSEVLKMLKVQ